MQDNHDRKWPGEPASPKGRVWQDPTRAVHGGPRPCDQRGLINPPVDRASTIIYDSVEPYMDRHKGLYDEVIYGLYGTRTNFALAEDVSELQGGRNTVIPSSGTTQLAQATTAFQAAGSPSTADACVIWQNSPS